MAIAWLVVAVIALVGELFTLSFYLVYEAAAAGITALVALWWPSLGGQVVVFAAASVFALGFVRPRTVELLFRVRPEATVAFPDLQGKAAVVRERVTDLAGLVEVGSGEFWSARAQEAGAVFEPGTEVVISRRDGIRVFVTLAAGHRPGPQESDPRAEEADR